MYTINYIHVNNKLKLASTDKTDIPDHLEAIINEQLNYNIKCVEF